MLEDIKEETAKWYAIQTYHGHEGSVRKSILSKVKEDKLEEKILDVIVPEEDRMLVRGGKRVGVKGKIYPSYILVNMVADEDTIMVIKTIKRVSGFVGSKTMPIALSEKEVRDVFSRIEKDKVHHKIDLIVGEAVKIIDGPFGDLDGKISEIDTERGQATILVPMFGRETPVKLDVVQIRKI